MGTDADFVRTTVSLRTDLYQRARREGRTLSEILNEALASRYERTPDLFGRFPQVDTKDVRDHEDRV